MMSLSSFDSNSSSFLVPERFISIAGNILLTLGETDGKIAEMLGIQAFRRF
jgi:hypothetical protein